MPRRPASHKAAGWAQAAAGAVSTHQTKPMNDRQVKNSAGGFVYEVDELTRLRRFLVLGSEGGTFYIGENKLTADNAKALKAMVDTGRGPQAVAEIVAVSTAGRAPRQGPGLMALAICAKLGDGPTRKAALSGLGKVARTGTALFTFLAYYRLIDGKDGGGKGWGRGLRQAVSAWYLGRSPEAAAYQVTKYASREGFTHRDVLRLAHVRATPAAVAKARAAARARASAGAPTPSPTLAEARADAGTEEPEGARCDEWEMVDVDAGEGAAAEAEGAEMADAAPEASGGRAAEAEEEEAGGEGARASALARVAEEHAVVLRYAAKGAGPFADGGGGAGSAPDPTADAWPAGGVAGYLGDAVRLKALRSAEEEHAEELACALVAKRRFGWEHVGDTSLLRSPALWAAMLGAGMGLGALVRNLGRMTAHGVLNRKDCLAEVVKRLKDKERVRGSRLHPVAVLEAMRTYASGHGDKGKLGWEPEPEVVAALDGAFYLAFAGVEPTGARFLLAMDVSGSMDFSRCVGSTSLTPRDAAVAMAMATVRAESKVETVAFCSKIQRLALSKNDTLEAAIRRASALSFGATDCAVPMLYAMEKGIKVDAFVVYTDCETYFGSVHPVQALRRYRQKMKIPHAKLVVMGMSATRFTIADPEDAGMLDVVGMDASVPEVLSQFVKDEM